MPMIIPPQLIAASMSMLASLLSMAASIKNLMTKNKVSRDHAIELFKKTATSRDRDLLSDPLIHASVSTITMVISEPLLRQIADEAQNCESKHIQARREAKSQIDITKADINAAQCMCSVLRDIRRYNKGELPSNSLFASWWDSYNCPS